MRDEFIIHHHFSQTASPPVQKLISLPNLYKSIISSLSLSASLSAEKPQEVYAIVEGNLLTHIFKGALLPDSGNIHNEGD